MSQAPNTRSRRNHHRGREVVAWTTAGITFVGLMISLTNERRHEKLQYVEPILVQRSGMAPELILSATALLDDAALGRSSCSPRSWKAATAAARWADAYAKAGLFFSAPVTEAADEIAALDRSCRLVRECHLAEVHVALAKLRAALRTDLRLDDALRAGERLFGRGLRGYFP